MQLEFQFQYMASGGVKKLAKEVVTWLSNLKWILKKRARTKPGLWIMEGQFWYCSTVSAWRVIIFKTRQKRRKRPDRERHTRPKSGQLSTFWKEVSQSRALISQCLRPRSLDPGCPNPLFLPHSSPCRLYLSLFFVLLTQGYFEFRLTFGVWVGPKNSNRKLMDITTHHELQLAESRN